MAFLQSGRFISVWHDSNLDNSHSLLHVYPVPLALTVSALQASIYDVPGGFRAVMFDRFSGVSDKVSSCHSPI